MQQPELLGRRSGLDMFPESRMGFLGPLGLVSYLQNIVLDFRKHDIEGFVPLGLPLTGNLLGCELKVRLHQHSQGGGEEGPQD